MPHGSCLTKLIIITFCTGQQAPFKIVVLFVNIFSISVEWLHFYRFSNGMDGLARNVMIFNQS